MLVAAHHLHHHRAGDETRGERGPALSQQPARGQAENRVRLFVVGRQQVPLERIGSATKRTLPPPALEAAKEPQPDLHIRGDKAVRYEFVAHRHCIAAQRAGVRKIGFVTDAAINKASWWVHARHLATMPLKPTPCAGFTVNEPQLRE